MPTMPDLTGMNYQEARNSLQAAGIYVAYPAYAFMSPSQISVQWQDETEWTADSELTIDDASLFVDSSGGAPYGPGIVLGQSPSVGTSIAKGSPITLFVSAFPMSAVIG